MIFDKSRLARFLTTLLYLAGVLACQPVQATQFETGTSIEVSKLHIIDDDFFVFGDRLTVDGIITGDMLALVTNITIRGQIDYSADLCAWEINHEGAINGSLRAVGLNIKISGRIGRSAVMLGEDVRFEAGSEVVDDVTISASEVRLAGVINGNLVVNADRVVISGQIDGNADITADEITVSPGATIGGDLAYTAPAEDRLHLGAGADVNGERLWRAPAMTSSGSDYTFKVLRIACMLAAFILGIVVVRIFRPYAEESFARLRQHTLGSLAAGVLGALGLSVSIALCAISVLLLISGMVLMEGGVSGVAVLFLVFSILVVPVSSFASVAGVLVYASGVIVAGFVIGHVAIGLVKPGRPPLTAGALLLGLLDLTLLFWLDYVGAIVLTLTTLIGGGAILLGIRHCRANRPSGAPEIASTGNSSSEAQPENNPTD
jgi:cytoskeletal protein CcmA (bactofilin family)